MYFTPKTSFTFYSITDGVRTPANPAEFTHLMYLRSKRNPNSFNNEFFIDQIDLDCPEGFTLQLTDYKDWHTVMRDIGFTVKDE